MSLVKPCLKITHQSCKKKKQPVGKRYKVAVPHKNQQQCITHIKGIGTPLRQLVLIALAINGPPCFYN
jgi:hypothetical protein